MFNLALNCLTRYPLNSEMLTGSCDLNDIIENAKAMKRQKILEWLSSDDFNFRHMELQKARVQYSGQWFVESPEFMNWKTSAIVCSAQGYGICTKNLLMCSWGRKVGSHVSAVSF